MMLRALLTLSVLTLSVLLGACLDAGSAPVTTGISVPLSVPGPQGAAFTLRNAVFEVSASGKPPVIVETTEADVTASIQLNPGTYEVRLRDGWRMIRTAADGSEQVVQAVLASRNPQKVVVVADAITATSFDFLLGSLDGNLQITMGAHPARSMIADLEITERFVIDGEDFLAAYPGRRLTLSLLFGTRFQHTSIRANGDRLRTVTLGPIAMRVVGDPDGTLSQRVADHAGGVLDGKYLLFARSSGRQSGFVDVQLDRRFVFQVDSLTQPGGVDADGFPIDAGIHATGIFTLQVPRGADLSSLVGTATIRML